MSSVAQAICVVDNLCQCKFVYLLYIGQLCGRYFGFAVSGSELCGCWVDGINFSVCKVLGFQISLRYTSSLLIKSVGHEITKIIYQLKCRVDDEGVMACIFWVLFKSPSFGTCSFLCFYRLHNPLCMPR